MLKAQFKEFSSDMKYFVVMFVASGVCWQTSLIYATPLFLLFQFTLFPFLEEWFREKAISKNGGFYYTAMAVIMEAYLGIVFLKMGLIALGVGQIISRVIHIFFHRIVKKYGWRTAFKEHAVFNFITMVINIFGFLTPWSFIATAFYGWRLAKSRTK